MTAGKVGTVAAGGVTDSSKPQFDKLRVFYGHENQENIDVVYYSDALFYEDPRLYNVHLANAASETMRAINDYLRLYNLTDEFEAGRVKFWVTGHSRAGATANLTCRRLVEKIESECTGS